jgi:hypothetical protein
VIASRARHFDLEEHEDQAVLRATTTEELSAQIDRLLSDKKFYKEMQAAVRTVGEARGQTEAARDFIAVFERVIAQFRPPARVEAEGLISVVIPTYNRREALRQAIESSRAPGVEVVVVDDCGSDDTPAMLSKDYPWVKAIVLPQHFGQSRARNIGIENATGEYVKFLDDDDVHLPGWFEPLVGAAREGYDVVSVGCVAPGGTGSVQALLAECRFTSQIMAKKSALRAVGGFDIAITWQEEHELLKRLDDAAYKKVHLPVMGVLKQRLDHRGFIESSGGKGAGTPGRAGF